MSLRCVLLLPPLACLQTFFILTNPSHPAIPQLTYAGASEALSSNLKMWYCERATGVATLDE
jgi:hypothetical protein